MRHNVARGLCGILLAALAGVLTSIPAIGGTPCGGLQGWNCSTSNAGIQTGLTHQTFVRAKKILDQKAGATDKRKLEYSSRYDCPLLTVDDVLCAGAVQACAGNSPAQGLGPQLRLYQREVAAKGAAPRAWTNVGTTCSPEIAPGKPVLGTAQILAAFHKTAWSKPTVHIQPEGNVTLVTLPTYFEVKWPAAGFKPGEIDTVTLLGNPVRIRPTAHNYNYVFGDGTTSGRTTSSGGTYPDGDITHAYAKKGRYNTRIDITYGGEYSIGGGPWIPIPNTVTIPGQPQTLTVKTAHARLVSK